MRVFLPSNQVGTFLMQAYFACIFICPVFLLVNNTVCPADTVTQEAGFTNWMDKGSALVDDDELIQAENAYRYALKLKPENIDAQLALADVYALQEKWEDALAIYRVLAKNASGQLRVLTPYLRAVESSGNKEELLPVLKAMFRVNKDDVVAGMKYLKVLEKEHSYQFKKEYLDVLKSLHQRPGVSQAIQKKYTRAKNLQDSIQAVERAKNMNASDTIAMATVYEHQGKKDSAISIYLKYAGRFTGNYSYNVHLGELLLAIGRLQEAVSYYELALDAGTPDSLLTEVLSSLYLKEGKRYKAAGLWRQYGTIQLKFNKKDEARRAFEIALQTGLPTDSLLFDLAVLYWEREELDKAEQNFNRVIKASPGFHHAYSYLAKICLGRQQSGLAVEYLLSAIKYDPENVGYSEMLAGIFYASDEFEQTIRALSPVSEHLSPKFREMYAKSLRKLGKGEKALVEYKTSYFEEESSPLAVAQLAEIHLKNGDMEKAIEIIDQSEYAGEVLIEVTLAKAWIMQGKRKKGKNTLNDISFKDRQNASYHITNGLYFFKEGEYGKAMAEYRKALIIDPQHGEAVFNTGLCYIHLRNPIRAKEFFQNLKKFSDSTWVARGYLGLAMAFEVEKKPEAVEHHLKLSLNFRPLAKAMVMLIRFYLKTGRLTEVDNVFSLLGETGKFEVAEACMASEISIARGDMEKAYGYVEKAMKKHPESCQLQLTAARLAFAQVKLDHMENWSKKVVVGCPEENQAFYFLGIAERKKKDRKKADEYFDKFKHYGGDPALIPK
ncbi:MAG: tetratricopeptide repeat protein [Fibrobacteria bacterium]|nr:tetratricopeptide repeat protein [Fibrobacteria bacterium]